MFTCPMCGLQTRNDHGRTCGECGYRGDWIQPGEAHLYRCKAGNGAPCTCVDWDAIAEAREYDYSAGLSDYLRAEGR